jgi:hypothetical protein
MFIIWDLLPISRYRLNLNKYFNSINMKTSYILFFSTLITLFYSSCEKIILEGGDSAKPVVIGYLIPGEKITINVKREVLYGVDTTSEPINNLEVFITNQEIKEKLILVSDTGTYSTARLISKEGETYKMEFNYNNKLIEATTVVPSKPKNFKGSAGSIKVVSFTPGSGTMPEFPDPVKYTWDNSNKDYCLVVVKNIESNPSSISSGGFRRPPMQFRNQPTQQESYDINFQNFSYYGTHLVILYHLNPEYATLYQQNGNNSLNLTTPPTNIVNGLGIFTGINSDTLNIEVY